MTPGETQHANQKKRAHEFSGRIVRLCAVNTIMLSVYLVRKRYAAGLHGYGATSENIKYESNERGRGIK